MKRMIHITALTILAVFFSCSSSNSNKNIAFKVWGNCEMCKETIETALKLDGIVKADWNTETKQIAITYDTLKIAPLKIHEAIAGVGYDTELLTGDSTAYANLHGCCQYDRKAAK